MRIAQAFQDVMAWLQRLETGDIQIRRYVAVDDCGKIINPLIVAGQVHGGVAQGLGQALCEQAVYDDNGQLITGEFTDYAIPKAHLMPWIESSHTETPSPSYTGRKPASYTTFPNFFRARSPITTAVTSFFWSHIDSSVDDGSNGCASSTPKPLLIRVRR